MVWWLHLLKTVGSLCQLFYGMEKIIFKKCWLTEQNVLELVTDFFPPPLSVHLLQNNLWWFKAWERSWFYWMTVLQGKVKNVVAKEGETTPKCCEYQMLLPFTSPNITRLWEVSIWLISYDSDACPVAQNPASLSGPSSCIALCPSMPSPGIWNSEVPSKFFWNELKSQESMVW